jgi:NAD(P)-dependent dehydrogenase (short-subunit alcohol dehydrogenase family)
MDIRRKVGLVTGANRGLGRAFAQALLDAGATKVYAAARNPGAVSQAGVTAIRLDVTDAASIAVAAAIAGDAQIVVNNAGITEHAALLGEGGAAALRRIMETNFYGMLAVSRGFAPVLKTNGGGALVNMLSVLSWISPRESPYSVAKAAAWALTNGLRNELRDQGTLVMGVHAGYIDTGMTAAVEAPKERPEDIAARVIEGLLAGSEEVLTDDASRRAKLGFNATPALYLRADALRLVSGGVGSRSGSSGA